MTEIAGIYEVAIRVRDMERARTFYMDTLGLEFGLEHPSKPWIFLRAGGQRGMLVLQAEGPDFPSQHYAFTVPDAELDEAVAALRAKGVKVTDPVTIDWMPARSAYFSDPDGHALEFCAPLER
jgi:lactoylglutathione lyase